MNTYILECLKEANKSIKKNDVPVGAVVVYDGKIIGRGHNTRLKTKDVTNHAEIVAIKNAAKKIKDWRLNECDLYVTLEPCKMCMEVIKESRIRNVFYLIKKSEEKNSFSKTNICPIVENEILKKDYKKLLSDFFKLNCNR